MKQYKSINVFLTAVAVAATLAVSGCEIHETGPQTDDALRTVTIGTSVEGAATKAEIAEDLKFSWTPGDQIAVWAENSTSRQYYISAPYVSNNRFSVQLSGTRSGYVIYPEWSVDPAAATALTLRVSLPESYDLTGKDDNYSPMPMIGKNVEGNDVQLYHVGGLLRLKVTNVPTGAAKIKVDLGHRITGVFTVQNPTEAGASTIVTDDVTYSGNTFVTFTNFTLATDGSTLLNVPIPTGTYETVTITALAADDSEINSASQSFATPWNCARNRGKHFTGEIASYFLVLSLEVNPWADGGENTIDYSDAVSTTSFVFHGTGDDPYPSSGVTIDNSTWTMTFDDLSGELFLHFTIASPTGATWSVQMEDPSHYFTLHAMDENGIAVAPMGTVNNSEIVLRIRPNAAAIPSSRTAAYSMVLHTFVEVGDDAYNIDSETQLYDVYGKLASFIIPANE